MSILRAFDENVQPLKFARGPLSLFAGVKWLFAHPKYLLLGALPALIAGALLIVGLVFLVIFSNSLASLLDPVTKDLWPWLARTIHVTLQGAIVAGGAVLGYVLFTALALAIGDPIYSKIAEVIEEEAGTKLPEASWMSGIKDALMLVAKGLLVAIIAFVLSLIPVVGGILGLVVTWTLLPFFLAEELLGRTLVPKGIIAQDKAKLLMRDKRAAWSFGATCQLLFSIPLVPVIIMPAAVAGAALLAREFVEERTDV